MHQLALHLHRYFSEWSQVFLELLNHGDLKLALTDPEDRREVSVLSVEHLGEVRIVLAEHDTVRLIGEQVAHNNQIALGANP